MLNKFGKAGSWIAGGAVVALACLQAFGMIGNVTGITDYVAPHSPISQEAARGFAEVVFVIAGAFVAAGRHQKKQAVKAHKAGKLDKPAVLSKETRDRLVKANPKQVLFTEVQLELMKQGMDPSRAARAAHAHVHEGQPVPLGYHLAPRAARSHWTESR